MLERQPNPGSDAARDAGCRCPVLDNGHGRSAPFPPDGWWINEECPMHGADATRRLEETRDA